MDLKLDIVFYGRRSGVSQDFVANNPQSHGNRSLVHSIVAGAEARFVSESSHKEVTSSLNQSGVALQSLNVLSILRRNLLNTNAIENSFRNTRNKLGRVTRFRAETDQATRWLSFAVVGMEKGFRRISGTVTCQL